jgi:hypothetical protein
MNPSTKNSPEKIRLLPKFNRLLFWSLLWFGVACVLAYLHQGIQNNHWWSQTYILSLTIPYIAITSAIWFGTVPRLLEYNSEIITLHFWWTGPHTKRWEKLTYHGIGNQNLLLLQFGTDQAFPILPTAYSKKEWTELTTFLNTHYPEKKASGWIGMKGFRWKK